MDISKLFSSKQTVTTVPLIRLKSMLNPRMSLLLFLALRKWFSCLSIISNIPEIAISIIIKWIDIVAL